MVRTFLDSGVLLAAARSLGRDRERALQILEDADRTFVTSPFVHLELVPKAIFYKKRLEEAFYHEYFNAAELARCDEFVTTERPGKPIYRSSLIRIVRLFD